MRRFRLLLILTAIVSSILGAVAVYLALTVPNDVQADAMLKQARTAIDRKENAKARDTLRKIVQQYPRTDAAAAAIVALEAVGNDERQQLTNEVESLTKRLAAVETKAAAPPPPAPAPVVEQAPAPQPTVEVVKPAPKKKTRVHHTRSRHRRRRR